MQRFSISRFGFSTELNPYKAALLTLGLCAAAILAHPAAGKTSTVPSLDVLARADVWPSLSGAILYKNRLWVVNSVKGRNHNSADLYSFDPANNSFRYEHHLFSQDAGDPTIHAGRLYWPLEDDRFSLGWGGFAATNGADWFNGTIPGRQIFHTHAMTSDGNLLYASNSGWNAKLNISSDGGLTWKQIYQHPTPPGVVSRFTSLTALNGALLAQLIVRGSPRMTVFRNGRLSDLKEWPKGRTLYGDAVHGRRYYAAISGRNGQTEIWSTDGYSSEQIDRSAMKGNAVDLASTADALWAVSAHGGSGSVWKMRANGEWRETFRLSGGYPRQIILTGKDIFVVGDGSDGKGTLWGSQIAVDVADKPATKQTVTGKFDHHATITNWQTAGAQLDRLLASPDRYRSEQRNLRDTVYRMAVSRPPDGFFKARLERLLPEKTISLIGGQVRVAAAGYARWVLLWGMGLSREGRVPLELISAPWSSKSNRAEKYFDPAPATLWAVRASGQRDRATVDTLVSRLSSTADPKWLKVQIAATLRALTGRPFNTDTTQWTKWWRNARSTWPPD